MTQRTVSGTEAQQMVGRALFREWIAHLSEDEMWLIGKYPRTLGKVTLKSEPSSILPGRVTYVPNLAGEERYGVARGSPLDHEIEKAHDRNNRRSHQYDKVRAWLQEHGFDPFCGCIDRTVLVQAMASILPSQKLGMPKAVPESGSNSAILEHVPAADQAVAIPSSGDRTPPIPLTPKRRRGPRQTKLDRTIAAMRRHLADGELTRAALDRLLEKNMSDRYNVSRDTARKARNTVLSENVENSILDN
jgi:hypothetical protein